MLRNVQDSDSVTFLTRRHRRATYGDQFLEKRRVCAQLKGGWTGGFRAVLAIPSTLTNTGLAELDMARPQNRKLHSVAVRWLGWPMNSTLGNSSLRLLGG